MTLLDRMSALVVVDVQKGILDMVPTDAAAHLVDTSTRLADAFHAAGLPVVWVHATGLPPGRVERPIPEPDELPADFAVLDGRLPVAEGDHHVYKVRTWSAFPRTDLAEHLRARGVTQVVLTGIATGGGVESTGRSAYDEGFTVAVAADACLDGNQARHAACLSDDIPAFGLVTDTTAVIDALATPGR